MASQSHRQAAACICPASWPCRWPCWRWAAAPPRWPFAKGEKLVAQDKVEAGLAKYQEAIAADPGNAQYKAAWLIARDRTTACWNRPSANWPAARPGGAAGSYQRVLSIDPANERARAGLRLVEADERSRR
jgi:general secretion pathway protein D